jgi:2-dehydro-3-deoxygalactonokinase
LKAPRDATNSGAFKDSPRESRVVGEGDPVQLSNEKEATRDRFRPPPGSAVMIAVDWGTSQLRAYRLDSAGAAIESRERPEGILAVPAGGFPAALDAIVEGWEADAGRVLMSGMVGSQQGWLETPYAECPADLEAIARGVRPVPWRAGSTALICPGLTCRDRDGAPDVMRGEEVQVMGALALRSDAGVGSIVTAGTHSKHVRIAQRTITGFSTSMTGEVFAVLKSHSILGRTMEAGGAEAEDDAAFDAGVARARQGGGVLHHLFGVRTRVLLGEMSGKAAPDYLSGVLIGHTFIAAAPEPPMLIIGAPALAERYRRAAAILALAAEILPAESATLAGLAAVDRMIRD